MKSFYKIVKQRAEKVKGQYFTIVVSECSLNIWLTYQAGLRICHKCIAGHAGICSIVQIQFIKGIGQACKAL